MNIHFSWLLPHEQAICFSLIWLSRNKSVQKSRLFTSRSQSRSILISLFTSRKRVKAFFFHFALLEKEWKLFIFTFHFSNFKNPLSLVPDGCFPNKWAFMRIAQRSKGARWSPTVVFEQSFVFSFVHSYVLCMFLSACIRVLECGGGCLAMFRPQAQALFYCTTVAQSQMINDHWWGHGTSCNPLLTGKPLQVKDTQLQTSLLSL